MIDKSSRHSKIIGNFSENLLCIFLSRSGFEVTIIDHTGLNIIAYHKMTKINCWLHANILIANPGL